MATYFSKTRHKNPQRRGSPDSPGPQARTINLHDNFQRGQAEGPLRLVASLRCRDESPGTRRETNAKTTAMRGFNDGRRLDPGGVVSMITSTRSAVQEAHVTLSTSLPLVFTSPPFSACVPVGSLLRDLPPPTWQP